MGKFINFIGIKIVLFIRFMVFRNCFRMVMNEFLMDLIFYNDFICVFCLFKVCELLIGVNGRFKLFMFLNLNILGWELSFLFFEVK